MWLAAGEDPAAQVTGRYFYHLREGKVLPDARKEELQERYLAECERITGVRFPDTPAQ